MNGSGSVFEIGNILKNKYEITGHIGTGGGGIVYKANQIGLDRTVAIKQIKDEVRGVIEERSEADILKKLKNNYIPTVFDFFSDDDDKEFYIVMEFVEGKSFQQFIESGKSFSQKKLLKYAKQLCEAVVYLHSRKPPIIHSDIKPANLMLTPEDNICLIDYNISLIFDGNQSAIGVSDGYSPPEQYRRANPHKVNDSQKDALCEYSNSVTAVDDSEYNSFPDSKTLIDTLEKPDISEDKTLIDMSVEKDISEDKTLIDTSVGKNIFEDKTLIDTSVEKNISEDKTLIDTSVEKNIYEDKTLIDTSANDYITDGRTFIDDSTVCTKTLVKSPATLCEEIAADVKRESISRQTETKTDRRIDKRLDIYSIGATFYGIALGKRPEAAVPLKERRSDISESFSAIIEKAMQEEPSKRFSSAEQMLKALNNLRRYDKRYKRLIFRQEAAAFIVIAAMAISCLTSVMGYMRLGDESAGRYDMLISEMDNADVSEAMEYCDKASEIFPDRAEAYEKMALIIYEQGDYAAAAEYAEGVISGGKLYIGGNKDEYSYGKLYYIVGRCYIELEKYGLAAESLKKAVTADRTEISYYCDYAVSLARCGNVDKAEEILDFAIKNGLSDADILFVRSEVEFARKNYTKAIENVKSCIAAIANEEYIYRVYMIGANAYLQMYANSPETGEERIEFLSEAINALPVEKTVPFYEMLAQAYIDEAETQRNDLYYSKALQTYEKMDSHGWGTLESDYMMIKLYRNVGNYEYAKEYAEKLLESNKDDYVLYKLLAFAEADIQDNKENSERDYTDFCAYYEKAAELCTDDEDTEMQRLAEAYNDAKERERR